VLCAVALAALSGGGRCPRTVRELARPRGGRVNEKLARLSQICFGEVRGGVLLGPSRRAGVSRDLRGVLLLFPFVLLLVSLVSVPPLLVPPFCFWLPLHPRPLRASSSFWGHGAIRVRSSLVIGEELSGVCISAGGTGSGAGASAS
jgi:hypothetical protein